MPASAQIVVSDNITFETLSWSNIFDTFFANNIELTSNCIFIDGVCYNSITFLNPSMTESQIHQISQTNIISININDSDGFISSATVGITFNGTETNYTMSGGNDTWTHDFKTGVTGDYEVTHFYATDNDFGVNSTSSNLKFTVVPISGGSSSSGGGGGGGGNYIVNNYNVGTSNNPPLVNIKGSGLNWNINIQNEGNASQEYIINWQLRNSLGIIIDHGTTSKQLLPDEIYSLPIILSTFLPPGGYTIKVNVQYGIYISEANQFFSVGTIYSNDEIIIALLILSGIFLLSIYSRNTKK